MRGQRAEIAGLWRVKQEQAVQEGVLGAVAQVQHHRQQLAQLAALRCATEPPWWPQEVCVDPVDTRAVSLPRDYTRTQTERKRDGYLRERGREKERKTAESLEEKQGVLLLLLQCQSLSLCTPV